MYNLGFSPLMWSEADRLHIKVTPRIFSEFSRVMSWIPDMWCCHVLYSLAIIEYDIFSLGFV